MQMQPPELLYKKAVLKISQYILRETIELEYLFNSEYCEVFESTYFEEHLRTTASEYVVMKLRKITNCW